MSSARDVAVDGSFAYVADGVGSLKVVDISTPTAPRLIATTDAFLGGTLNDVVKVRSFTFGADFLFPNGVPIVDVSDPSAPQVRARLDFPDRGFGTGIAADSSFVYLTAARGADTRLYIGRYLTVTDDAGVPPTVTISSPPDGSEHFGGATLTVRADARDDVDVAAVTFGVDGIPTITDSTAPFSFNYRLPVDASSVTFTATATDFGGNDGQAAPLTVRVIPAPTPSVTLQAPVAGRDLLFEGQPITLRAFASSNSGLRIRSITFSVNGVALAAAQFDLPEAVYSVTRSIPWGTTRLVVIASATDGLGLTGSTTHAFDVASFPRTTTTVTGRVVDGLDRPVAGARVFVDTPLATHVAITSPDGAFATPVLTTVLGRIICVRVPGDAGPACRVPVPGGTTDVGVIRAGTIQVGYYDLRGGPVGEMIAPIVTAGMTPVAIQNSHVQPAFDAADLSAIDILFVNNERNNLQGYGGARRANLSRVFDWISRGGVFVFHDWVVDGADIAAVLPGSPGNILRDVGAGRDDIDIVDDTTAVTNGPGGVLLDSSLDNGASSSHGFAAAASIPQGARGILSRANPAELVLYAYPHGHGWVVYSTIPLSHYLEGGGSVPAFRSVYAPNVLAFARDLLLGR
jgi:hypothetical protein